MINLTDYEIKLIIQLLKERKEEIDEALIYGDDDAATLRCTSHTFDHLIKKFENINDPFVQRQDISST